MNYVFFYQNKKQKTSDDFCGNSAPEITLSHSLIEAQNDTQLCAGMPSLESPQTKMVEPLGLDRLESD